MGLDFLMLLTWVHTFTIPHNPVTSSIESKLAYVRVANLVQLPVLEVLLSHSLSALHIAKSPSPPSGLGRAGNLRPYSCSFSSPQYLHAFASGLHPVTQD